MKTTMQKFLRIAAIGLTLTPAVLFSQDFGPAPGPQALGGAAGSATRAAVDALVPSSVTAPQPPSAFAQPAPGQFVPNQPAIGGGIQPVDPGTFFQPGQVDGPVEFDPGMNPIGDNFFETGESRGSGLFNRGNSDVNSVIGIGGMVFRRNFSGSTLLSTGPSGALFSEDADFGDLGGVEAYLIRRRPGGRGVEARFFTLLSTDDTEELFDATTALGQFAGLSAGGTDLLTLYNTVPNVHTVTRDIELTSVEVNMLRRDIAPRIKRETNGERIFGFRYFAFNENIQFNSLQPSGAQVGYNASAENSLFGFQLGKRGEYRLAGRFSLALAGKLGIFNNRSRSTNQAFSNDASGTLQPVTINSGPSTGTTFGFGDQKDELSFLGEVDAGLIFSMSQSARFRVGYRALGITDVALPEQQIPGDFTDIVALQTTLTDSDVTFDGAYFGFELAY